MAGDSELVRVEGVLFKRSSLWVTRALPLDLRCYRSVIITIYMSINMDIPTSMPLAGFWVLLGGPVAVVDPGFPPLKSPRRETQPTFLILSSIKKG